ncbi:hypothetical protein XELAEV_18035196mg [Xenopus laevis]|uniref:Uncharacterized protein n=1 Tax=Xenopus laevis TaxID=8355 RepID=A0A974HBU4_XENLA|nr:hypothetical protein XELAEV_18035196mg [Xenopus laevis]
MKKAQKGATQGSSQRTPMTRKENEINKFFNKPSPTQATDSDSNMADDDQEGVYSSRPQPPSSPTVLAPLAPDLSALIAALPQKADLTRLLDDIKEAQKRETAEIKRELAAMTTRIDGLEEMQDAENRSRGNNVRIRGIPEEIPQADLKPTLMALFNNLLEQDQDTAITIERLHRVAGNRTGRVRDVLCCLHNFTMKEQILRREAKIVQLKGDTIEIYQDLAHSPVYQRCLLREVTSLLKASNINYKWGFPFALLATQNGKTYSLKDPTDAPLFFNNLGLPCVDLQEWGRFVYTEDNATMGRPKAPDT